MRPALAAKCFSGQQVPRSLQLSGQVERWHETPSYPGKHEQVPVLRSQDPLLEHSTQGCKLLELMTSPTQAKSRGHVRREQSGPVHSGSPSKPVKHLQLLFFSQVPWLEQWFSHKPPLRWRRLSQMICPQDSEAYVGALVGAAVQPTVFEVPSAE